MQHTWQKIIAESRLVSDTNNLEGLLFARIQKRIRLINTVRLISYVTASLISIVLLFICTKYMFNDFYNSGTYSYFHLIVSEDTNTLALFSKEILYALIESLPIMSMTLSFGLLFAFMVSLNGIILSLRKNFVF